MTTSIRTKLGLAFVAVAAVFALAAGPAAAQDPDAPSIAEIAADEGSFTTLVTALDLVGLTDTFADCSAGPFTVLAPNDDAFTAALAALGLEVADLVADPDLVTTILQYHVVPTVATSDVVAALDGTSAPTLQGEEITVAVDGDAVSIVNGNPTPANVIAVDILACNGVIHVIDNVLLPPTVVEALAGGAAQDDSSDEGTTDEEPADEELANTGANSALITVVAASILLGGGLMVLAARPSLQTGARRKR